MTSRRGSVRNAELCAPLEGVRIARKDADGKPLQEIETDAAGEWRLQDVRPGETLTFEKPGFIPKTIEAERSPECVRLLEDRPVGYQDKLGYLPGEEVRACIHAPRPFLARLYRHGFRRTLALDCGAQPASPRQVPDGKFVEPGLSWKENLQYRIPDTAKPGLYSLAVEGFDEPFAVPFLVSTPPGGEARRSKVLVLASTNTWQTYNLWGGRSRYRNFEDASSEDFIRRSTRWGSLAASLMQSIPPDLRGRIKKIAGRAQPDWKFKRLSIRRPFTNCRLEEDDPNAPFTNHLAGGEWRLLAWLERENIDYDILSGFELHRNPDRLRHYHVLILSTHSEYWSLPMYRGLKKYHHENGLWILNLSGNSIFRCVDFFDDGSLRCTHYFFHETGEDETRILGVRFTEADYGSCAPYEITDPSHWVFENVPVPRGKTTFGESSLNRNTPNNYARYDPGRPGLEEGLDGVGASGWETDKLHGRASKDFHIVAKGLNRGGGADMVVRDSAGTRGGLFSASSITFTGSLLVDEVCAALVKNVLRRALEKTDV